MVLTSSIDWGWDYWFLVVLGKVIFQWSQAAKFLVGKEFSMNEEFLAAPVEDNHRIRNITMLAGVSIGLIIAVAAFILLDPFGLNLFGRSMELAAQAMPPDVVFYMGVDLRKLQSEDLDTIVWAFSEELKRDQVSVDHLLQMLVAVHGREESDVHPRHKDPVQTEQ